MSRHLKINHEKIKPYECEFCSKTFGQKNILTVHIRITHEKIKPHKCKDCDKKFSERGDLNKHFKSKTHFNIKMKS